jgi:hypothetical protein
MADPVVWAPMPDWPAAFVPKTFNGVREWDADGPKPPPGTGQGDPAHWRVYAWAGPRLVCVNCPEAVRWP